MATDLEKLVVSLSADFRSYENAMAKASGITRQQLKLIKADAGSVGKAAEDGFRRMGAAVQASRGNVINFRSALSNLGLQAQDVAVQLSMGTSAMRVFGQQAPQILGGFGPLGIAIGAAAAALPLLATALGDSGDNAEAFTASAEGLEKALTSLKAAGFEVTEATELFGAALRKISETTTIAAIDAVQAQLRAMTADVMAAVTEIEGVQFGGGVVTSGVDAFAESMRLSREEAQALFDAMVALANATDGEVVAAAQRVVNEVANIAAETGKISPEMQAVADAAQAAGQAAATMADNTVAATGAAQGLASTWQQVLANAQGAMMAAGQALAATEKVRQAQAAVNNSRPTSFGGALGAGAGDFPVSGIPSTPASVFDQQFPVFGSPLTVPSASGGGGGRRGGGGGGADRAANRAAAEEQRQIASALRDSIREVADAQREVQRENERTAESFADVFLSAIDGSGNLEDTLRSLAAQIARTFITTGFEQLLGAGGGSFLGGIFGGARASGGPVSAGKSYLVGERGPELFMPRAGGSIVPNGAGGGDVAVRVFVDQDGNWQAAVARTAGAVSAQVVNRMAPSVVANAQKRAG
jgi:hypothetical protein